MPKNSKSFSEKLRDSAQQTGSIICVGYDPAPVDFPQEGISGYDDELPDHLSNYEGSEVEKIITEYFEQTLTEMRESDEFPGAFKPNLAYYEGYNNQEGYWGSNALKSILGQIKDLDKDIPIILDSKRGDIGRTSAAYADGDLKGRIDAMTVNPFMGSDCVGPFFVTASGRGQGAYVLTRTSNPGAEDFQDLKVVPQDMDLSELTDTEDLDSWYKRAANKVAEWHEDFPGTVGAVVGATSPDELGEIAHIFHDKSTKGDIPMLVPGVGTQGGTVEEVTDVLEDVGYDLGVVRINSSSGTMYRAQKEDWPSARHSKSTLMELIRMNNETRKSKSARKVYAH